MQDVAKRLIASRRRWPEPPAPGWDRRYKARSGPPLPFATCRSAKRCIAADRARPLRSRAIIATAHCEATRLLRQIHLTQKCFIAGIAPQVLQQWIPGYPWHPAVVQLVGT